MRRLVHTAGRVRTIVHRLVFRASRGRVLRTWGGLAALQLTTTGRLTGRPVSTMLVAVGAPPGTSGPLLVAASDGGADVHPQWYLNLCRHPQVEVLMHGRRPTMTARTAGPAERAALWPVVIARSPAYARYQARTSRVIPLVILEELPESPG